MPQFIHANVAIDYTKIGEGAPVLFIQGVGVPGQGWKPQMDALSTRFTCVSFDNRGVGGSSLPPGTLTIAQMVEDTRALLDHLGWASAHLVGHSMGGIIAHQLALAAPERVRSLSLLCTFPRGKDAARLTPWVMWVGLRTRVGTARMRRHAFLEILLPASVIDRDAAAAAYSPFFGRDIADQHPMAMAQVMAMSKHDEEARLSTLRAPTLVVSGAEDKLAIPEFGERLAAAIPGAAFHRLEGVSHGAPLTHPEVVNALLLDHLTAVESSRSIGT